MFKVRSPEGEFVQLHQVAVATWCNCTKSAWRLGTFWGNVTFTTEDMANHHWCCNQTELSAPRTANIWTHLDASGDVDGDANLAVSRTCTTCSVIEPDAVAP
eukprot:5314275-Pyramimonas_sp.AAC.1